MASVIPAPTAVDNVTLEDINGVLSVKDGGVSDAKLAKPYITGGSHKAGAQSGGQVVTGLSPAPLAGTILGWAVGVNRSGSFDGLVTLKKNGDTVDSFTTTSPDELFERTLATPEGFVAGDDLNMTWARTAGTGSASVWVSVLVKR